MPHDSLLFTPFTLGRSSACIWLPLAHSLHLLSPLPAAASSICPPEHLACGWPICCAPPPPPLCRTVYSLVRFGGVRNYVMLTWTAADLAACADLNLPCADVAALLAEPLSE